MGLFSFNASTASELDAMVITASFQIRKLQPRKFIWLKWAQLINGGWISILLPSPKQDTGLHIKCNTCNNNKLKKKSLANRPPFYYLKKCSCF